MHNKTMEIEFDARKAYVNQNKHGVSFEEAASALIDPYALVQEDTDSECELRWTLLGMSNKQRILTVIYTLREKDTIRIISARKATYKEYKYYA